jgi:membrane protein implicated in regulation of membrane protease activity
MPKHTPHESILVPMVFLVNIMAQFGVALLFLYRNLTYLALVSVIVSVLLIVLGQLYQKPFLEHIKQSQREN